MRHLITSVTIIIVLGTVQAQLPSVAVGLFKSDEDGTIELRLKSDAQFNGLYSASSFTIRWPVGTPLTIDSISQPIEVQAYHPIAKQGLQETDVHYNYQKFAGFGMLNLADVNVGWTQNTEYTLLKLHASGSPTVGEFELIEDGWTWEQNCDNYQELNGEERTLPFYQTVALLPLDMYAIEANPVDNRHASIYWNTSGEYKLSHFDLLRSTDQTNWTLIETTPAAGFSNSQTTYDYLDYEIHPDDKADLTVYYLIRAHDQHGDSTDFPIQTVEFYRDPLWHPYNVHPNPATDVLNVEVPVEWGSLNYLIINELGQRLKAGDLPEGGGPIEVTSLPASAMVIHVTDEYGHPVMDRTFIHTHRD